jgi:transcriptional regulator
MRPNPQYEVTDPRVVRALIAENPWSTIVSHTDDGLVASHYPVLLDETSEDLVVVTHVGRPDEQLHRFGTSELLVIVAGTHGYISPSWYSEHAGPVPTWNFSVAHCYGTPQILDADENLRVLTRLVDHFERAVDTPVVLDQQVGAQIATGTVGIRLQITRFVCKVKMSQDKDPQSQRQVLDALRRPGPYSNPLLADQMQHALTVMRSRSASGV